MNGILLVNKPKGFTSFDVIAKLRGILKIKRLGHSGTLDPMATGVLPVFIGKATRACDILPNNDKSYIASFRFGLTTDTQDSSGTTITTSDIKATKTMVLESLPRFRGEINQLPPMYSAVSVNGQRLYELARQGIEVERQPRKITVYSLDLLEFNENIGEGTLFISCSKGTYIRTIIHDLGISLGCGGIMTALVRNSASGFLLEDCLSFEDIIALNSQNKLKDKVIPIETIFNDFPAITLDNIQTRMYLNGVKLDSNRIYIKLKAEKYRIFSDEKLFLGTASVNKATMELVCEKNFFES